MYKNIILFSIKKMGYLILGLVSMYTFIFYGPIYLLGISAAKLGWKIYDYRFYELTSGKIAAITSLVLFTLLVNVKIIHLTLYIVKLVFKFITPPIKNTYYYFKFKYYIIHNTVGINFIIIGCFLVPVTFGVSLYEVYIRYNIYKDLIAIKETATIWLQDNTLTISPWDEANGNMAKMHHMGLFKTFTDFNISVIHPTLGPANFHTQTNNVGLLSDRNYEFSRNPDVSEYRIVILGDSMTGPSTSTYQWVDTLEDLLNSNNELRLSLNNKKIRLYNLGWVGAGFNSFEDAYKRVGQHFDPDLVLLNYIEVDFERLPKGILTNDSDKVNNASKHLKWIIENSRKFSITLMPTYNELIGGVQNYNATRLLEKSLNIPITIMRDKLPSFENINEIESWFNLPHDAHYSDRGGEIYARAIASHIAQNISGLSIDFTNAKSKNGDVLLPNLNTRLLQIDGPLAKIGNDKTAVSQLKENLYSREINAKVFSLDRFYTVKTLLGEKFGVNIPYDKLIGVSGFEQFKIKSNQSINLNLLLACVKKPITVDNPDCYHHRHFFVSSNN